MADLKAALPAVVGIFFAVAAAAADEPAPDSAGRIAQTVRSCAACHGENGVSTIRGIPSLAGQHAPYLLEELEELRSGARPSEIMGPIAAGLAAEDLRVIADYFAGLPYIRAPQTIAPEVYERGRDAYLRLCQLCHPNDGKQSSYSEFPLLAGQDLDYMRRTIADILGGRRKANSLMYEMIRLAPLDRLDDALHYFAGQAVDPKEVTSARFGTSTMKRRRFKPAHTN